MSRMRDLCDICCDECGWWEPTNETTLEGARSVMKRQGWSRRGRHEDLCPSCTDKAKDAAQDAKEAKRAAREAKRTSKSITLAEAIVEIDGVE